MARQDDTCWSCAAAWDDRPAIGEARAAAQPSLDVDRWADEGGSVADQGSGRRNRLPIVAVR